MSEQKSLLDQIEIVKRKRTSLEIQIKPDGQIRVLVPIGATKQWVEQVIESKRPWIMKKLGAIEAKRRSIPRLYDGAMVFDRGEEVRLHIGGHEGIYPVERTQEGLHVHVLPSLCGDTDHVRGLLKDWYRKQTAEAVGRYVNEWSQRMNVKPTAIRIKDQKKRWGSCSSRGGLNFNWRLSMAPEGVLEYVVVHELCHFIHMNHSKAFWDLVETLMPDYPEKRAWLKENGQALFWLD